MSRPRIVAFAGSLHRPSRTRRCSKRSVRRWRVACTRICACSISSMRAPASPDPRPGDADAAGAADRRRDRGRRRPDRRLPGLQGLLYGPVQACLRSRRTGPARRQARRPRRVGRRAAARARRRARAETPVRLLYRPDHPDGSLRGGRRDRRRSGRPRLCGRRRGSRKAHLRRGETARAVLDPHPGATGTAGRLAAAPTRSPDR